MVLLHFRSTCGFLTISLQCKNFKVHLYSTIYLPKELDAKERCWNLSSCIVKLDCGGKKRDHKIYCFCFLSIL
uniref:Uncharacterized protein n=1 Tax=Rhizophora mucronata TaxID=61149 RepID=A0A2P2QDU7_RHIMU